MFKTQMSVIGLVPTAQAPVYTASKHAVVGFTRAVAVGGKF